MGRNTLIIIGQDMLRKVSYYNYEYYVNEGRGAFEHPEKQLKYHFGKRLHCYAKAARFYSIPISSLPLICFMITSANMFSIQGHCLESIRQQLMCTADTGLHPFLWVGNPPHIFPDFNREHKCKNFEAIREYAEKNQGTFDELDIVPEPGALVLPTVP